MVFLSFLLFLRSLIILCSFSHKLLSFPLHFVFITQNLLILFRFTPFRIRLDPFIRLIWYQIDVKYNWLASVDLELSKSKFRCAWAQLFCALIHIFDRMSINFGIISLKIGGFFVSETEFSGETLSSEWFVRFYWSCFIIHSVMAEQIIFNKMCISNSRSFMQFCNWIFFFHQTLGGRTNVKYIFSSHFSLSNEPF